MKKVKLSNDLRLKEKYLNEVVPSFINEHNYKNVMDVPKLNKIILNIGVGDATRNSKLLEDSMNELTLISGQKPVATKAKKSIAGFKLREGSKIGCKVTLRGDKMYHFLDKLITIYLPRTRDFRGISKKAFDGRGNYSVGIKEQIIFPEIDYDQIKTSRGLEVSIVTTAKNNEDGYLLLSKLGFPFSEKRSE